MRCAIASLFSVCLFAIGCGEPAANTPVPPAPTPPALNAPESPKPGGEAASAGQSGATAEPAMGAAATGNAAAVVSAPPEGFTPVAMEAGAVKLTPENTTIQIVGQHNPPRGDGPRDRDARTIVFEKFSGSMTIDPVTKQPKSATAEIDANSLVAFDPRLTSHLKSRDFIEVETYPTIKFESTRIEPASEPGKVTIVGNLTLKDVTKEISFPAMVTNDGRGVTVHGQTKLNRREFNINGARIDNSTQPEFDFTLAVGKQTQSPAAGAGR
jgi:polyisoprenoid-binding protein YceI